MKRYDGGLFVCFGTSDTEVFQNTFLPAYEEFEKKIKSPCFLCVTSGLIRDKLSGKVRCVAPEQGLSRLLELGCRRVIVFPFFVSAGREYDRVAETMDRAKAQFEELTVMEPVLPVLTRPIAEHLDRFYPRKDTVDLLVGHGAKGRSDLAYAALEQTLHSLGRPEMHVLLMNGETDLRECVTKLIHGKSGVRVIPLMISFGHHMKEITEDIRKLCEAEGISCEIERSSLGEQEEFRNIALSRL